MTATALETGSLGVYHMKRFYLRTMNARKGSNENSGSEWVKDVLLVTGLGLGLQETFRYLYKDAPSFEEFENWVLEINCGEIEAERIAHLNAALTGQKLEGDKELETMEPVLTASDLAFWDEHGYVSVHDAVPAGTCLAAQEAIWQAVKATPDNPRSWYGGPQGHSIMVPILHHWAMNANRKSPRLRKAFAQLWNDNDIWITVDRGGFNPPAMAQWPFPGPHLHWDVSLAPPIPFGLQGILYLNDVAADQGAFQCVPGFHRKFDAWLKNLPPAADPREEDLAALGAIPIPGKAGDLIIWRQELPHGSSPNRATFPRIVQYISAFPTIWDYNPEWL